MRQEYLRASAAYIIDGNYSSAQAYLRLAIKGSNGRQFAYIMTALKAVKVLMAEANR